MINDIIDPQFMLHFSRPWASLSGPTSRSVSITSMTPLTMTRPKYIHSNGPFYDNRPLRATIQLVLQLLTL